MKKTLIILTLLLVSTSTNASNTIVEITECGMYEMKAYYETLLYYVALDSSSYEFTNRLVPKYGDLCANEQIDGITKALDQLDAVDAER